MSPAIFTAFLFALSALCGARSARIFGSAIANLGRIIIALLLLGLWAFTFGKGLAGAGLYWFIISGCIGFGFGDMALFGAFPRIGPRLALLLTQCLAGPVAGLVEWVWLEQTIAPAEAVCGAAILVGVAAALLPDGTIPATRSFWIGVGFGIISAIGQGVGAVISRKANWINLAAATPIDGGTAAFQRMLGGFTVTLLCILALSNWRRTRFLAPGTRRLQPGWHYMVLNGLLGPALGVGCYQWALSTTPSAIVLAIVATSPVIVMLLQYLTGEEKPGLLSIAGAFVAVGGAVALASLQG
ncbi:MAG TPA: EamA family transporter [Chthoniobacterales bacterium]|jgi:drug/metabolite transporter (DMT)-like permease